MAYGFSFVFFRSNPDLLQVNNTAQTAPDDSFTPSEAKVYELLKQQPNLTREELAGKIGKTVKTVQRALDGLRNKQRIIRVGTSKRGYWEVR